MNTATFDPKQGPILLEAETSGPAGNLSLSLVIDTGATTSLINLATLAFLGIGPEDAIRHVRMTTGSAIEVVPIVTLTRLSVLGQHRFGVPVIAHALPPTSAVDGLLGLDFFRDHSLTIDFRAGILTLE